MKTIQEKNGEVEYVLTLEEYRRLNDCGSGAGCCYQASRIEALLAALRYIEGVAMADEPRDLPGIVKTARAAIDKAQELRNEHTTNSTTAG